MKRHLKKKTLFIILFILAFVSYFTYLSIHETILQNSILKIGISSDKYDSSNLHSFLTNCSLFKEQFSTYQKELAHTITKNDTTYLVGINNNFYFSDGSSVDIDTVKNTYSKYLSFDSKDDLLSSTPLTMDVIKKLVTPIVKKDKINNLTCGKYVTLVKNSNETVLGQNNFYPYMDTNSFKKIILKSIDLEERNESDILSDLIESRLDVLINVFNPQKSFSIISKYPKIQLKTFKSPNKAILLVKKESFTDKEIISFLSQIDISAISKVIYNSTIIPLLYLDASNSNSLDTLSSKKQPKQIYFATNSSIPLLRSSKIILSKINTNEFNPVLQVTNSDLAQEIIHTSPKINMALIYISSDSDLEQIQQQLPSWDSYPLWQYQDLVLFNKNLKDFSSLIGYTKPKVRDRGYL